MRIRDIALELQVMTEMVTPDRLKMIGWFVEAFEDAKQLHYQLVIYLLSIFL